MSCANTTYNLPDGFKPAHSALRPLRDARGDTMNKRHKFTTRQSAIGRGNSILGERLTPRESRVLMALWNSKGWIWREDIDRIACASNGPHIIMMLRRNITGDDGIEMQRVDVTDSDGKPSRPGRYRLTEIGRQRFMNASFLSETA
ncbi:MAG: hypothetical protein WAW69_04380 [Polaromonas sp.]